MHCGCAHHIVGSPQQPSEERDELLQYHPLHIQLPISFSSLLFVSNVIFEFYTESAQVLRQPLRRSSQHDAPTYLLAPQ